MGSEWKELSVLDLVEANVLDKPMDGNHGEIHPKGSDFVSTGIPFIMASNLINGQVDTVGCKFITKEQASRLRKGFSKTGDVLLSHKATIGRTAIVGETDDDYIMLTPQVTCYRIKDRTLLNNGYLKYYFDSEPFQHLLNQWAGGGSTRAYLGITGQQKLPIVVPPIYEQKMIAHILGSLDDKIELNRRINATLEGMAQALFKSWFVDFDPMIDNALAAGNSIPEELAERAEVRRKALADGTANRKAAKQFPAAFQLTEEMGWIPEGWEVKTSSSLFDVRDGTHDSPKQSATGKYLITSRHITGNTIDYSNAYLISEDDFEQANKRSKVDPYDILLTMIGTVGTPFLIMEEEIKFAIKNVGLFKTGVNRTLAIYFFTYLKSDFMTAFMESRLAGTTQKYLTLKILRALPITTPHSDIMKEFGDQTLPIFDKIHANNSTTDSLVALRDTLLPKLISGELRIPEAEKLTEEALA